MNHVKRWNELLNPKRIRNSSIPSKKIWNPFDSDYSRITFSPPFRRLQDKTQVFPLDKHDFVRTRLTHSIEVSSIGRSIGVRIENYLIENNYLDSNKKGYIPSILSVAGLVHDIGNPPFGHFGETVIQDYFINFFEKNKNNYAITSLDEQRRNDLRNFDGNVQSFRLLTKLNIGNDPYSYNLTYPSLATIIKYPKNSLEGNKKNKGIQFKKFGYFYADKDRFNLINDELNLNNSRYPLTFVLEACDDICYTASDLEDGVDKNIIKISDIKNLLKENKDDSLCDELLKIVLKIEKRDGMTDKLLAQNIRIFSQRKMIDAVVETFEKEHEALINQVFNDELLEISDAARLRNVFSQLGKKCFDDTEVLKRELLAKKVIETLLNFFIPAVLSNDFTNTKTSNGKLYALISKNFKHVLLNRTNFTAYDKMILVTDYISGMTDYYALNLYSNLIGIEV